MRQTATGSRADVVRWDRSIAQAASASIRQRAQALWPQVARAIDEDHRVISWEEMVRGEQHTMWQWKHSTAHEPVVVSTSMATASIVGAVHACDKHG